MANISLQSVYESMFTQFGVDESSPTFTADFLVATNRAIGKINNEADLATQIPNALNIAQDVTLDEKYEHCFAEGIVFNLVKMGRRLTGDPKRVPSVAELEGRFDAGVDEIYTDLMNAKDPTTDDITGLGAPQH